MKKQETTKKSLDRRSFLKRGSALAAGAALGLPSLVPSSVLGAAAPSNRITIGNIGLGGMGMNDLKSVINKKETQVLALCDVEKGSKEYGGYYRGRDLGLNPAKKLVEEYYAKQNGTEKYKGCDTYEDYRDLLARKDIDAVFIVTPDHWHVPMSIKAAKAGKDIFTEKPLTLTIGEGRRLVKAVRRYGRVLQTGSMQRSMNEFRFGCELVRNGKIGELKSIEVGIPGNNVKNPVGWKEQPVPDHFNYDMWLGPAPMAPYCKERCHYNFRFLLEYSGGQITNWGAHYLDIAQWGNDADNTGPVEIEGKGEFPTEGLFTTALTSDVHYKYANGVTMHLKTGNGYTKFVGTEGWVYVTRGKIDASNKSLLEYKIKPNEVHLYNSRDHIQDFLDCTKTRKQPICDVEIGHRSSTVCHLSNIAMRLGRKINWDPKKEKFVNDPEANAMLERPARPPYNI